MKSNNSTFILEMILLIVITLVLVGYYFNKLLKKSKQPVEKPTVIDADVDLILNPANAKQQVKENYSIFNKTEYSIGETTAKNIDIKLTWTNGPTFAPVESLIFVHKANGNSVRENVKTVDNIDSNASNELIFKGEKLTNENIVGDNTIDMYWNEVNVSNKLTTISFTVTEKHLDSTLNLDNSSTIDVPVQLSSSSTASGDVIAEYTKYIISPFFTDPVYIRKATSDVADKSFHVIKDNEKQIIDGVDTFYIVQALDNYFISKDASGDNILTLNGVTKEFVSKNDIFGNIDSVTKSSIEVNIVQDGVETCLFEPPNFETEGVNDFLDNTEFSERCQRLTPQMCESELLFFENSDFGDNTDYDIKDALENKEFKDICKKRVIYN